MIPKEVPNTCDCERPKPDHTQMVRPYDCRKCGKSVMESEHYE